MHVLLVGECPWIPSSLGKITLHTSRGLVEEGFRVTVACRALPGFPADSYTYVFNPSKWSGGGAFGVPEWDLDIHVMPYFTGQIAWLIAARKQLIDVLLVYGTPYGQTEAETLGTMTQNLRIPVVTYALDDAVDSLGGPVDPVLNSSVIATPSNDVREKYVDAIKKRTGINAADRIVVAYHGYDPETWSPDWVVPIPKSIDVVFYSKNHVRKDFEALARAGVTLSKRLGRLRIALYPMGSGPWNLGLLRSMIADFDAAINEGRLEVAIPQQPWDTVGFLESHIMYEILSSKIGAFMTIGEAFGLVALEFALLETPFVVTDIPVTREIWGEVLREKMFVKCEKGEYIIGMPINLCRPDHESLSDAIEYTLTLDLTEEGRRLREHASKKYHYKTMVKGLMEAIDKALDDPTRLKDLPQR